MQGTREMQERFFPPDGKASPVEVSAGKPPRLFDGR